MHKSNFGLPFQPPKNAILVIYVTVVKFIVLLFQFKIYVIILIKCSKHPTFNAQLNFNTNSANKKTNLITCLIRLTARDPHQTSIDFHWISKSM